MMMIRHQSATFVLLLAAGGWWATPCYGRNGADWGTGGGGGSDGRGPASAAGSTSGRGPSRRRPPSDMQDGGNNHPRRDGPPRQSPRRLAESLFDDTPDISNLLDEATQAVGAGLSDPKDYDDYTVEDFERRRQQGLEDPSYDENEEEEDFELMQQQNGPTIDSFHDDDFDDYAPSKASSNMPQSPAFVTASRGSSGNKATPGGSVNSNRDSDDDHRDLDGLSSGAGKEALYDAYNQLHTLAQEYDKPFDAPAVVVVGHQSSGKSALIEALMGFQFNQVGGGTKTRRPVALRLQYNPKCREPKWYLIGEDGIERAVKLSDVQDYIEKENRRLERDPMRSFESKEINIRMEYRHCPNMILIDTPGLIAAPRIPKGRMGGPGSAYAQQRALHASAKEAEQLVVEKMRCEDYIILCVEDNSDWKHGATREIVQKADPDLCRTVIVNTKFDTKVPQFGTPSDVEDFLRALVLDNISPHRLGGPFFTSVPSGRVDHSSNDHNRHHDYADFNFASDEVFVHACGDAEKADRAVSLQRLKRSNNKVAEKVAAAGLTSRIGLSKLRSFLENRVDECYRRNVRKIIPMLQSEYVNTERRLQACERELEALSVERLKAGAEAFSDDFCSCLRKAIQGSIVAPPNLFGETLKQETAAAGSFHAVNGCPMAVSDRTWERLVETEVGGRDHRLYGGSQYHRTLREFQLATKCVRLATLQEDEIANAAGLGENHDGVNYLHAACTISVEKARSSFDPLLQALQTRMKHVMSRLCPVAEYMLRETRERTKRNSFDSSSDDEDTVSDSIEQTMDISMNPQFKQLIRNIFDKFVLKCSESATSKCRDDLNAITRYVSWSLDDRSSGGFNRALPDQTDMLSVYQVVLKSRKGGSKSDESGGRKGKSKGGGGGTEEDSDGRKGKPTLGELTESKPLTPMVDDHRDLDSDYRNLLRLMEEAVMARDIDKTTLLVGGLVQHIVANWQLHFCRSVTSKFNCYFMLPFVDEFHRFMRKELRKVYEGDTLSDVFDMSAARRALQQQREELIGECLANKGLQEKFRHCSRMMKKKQSGGKGSQPFTFRPELEDDEA